MSSVIKYNDVFSNFLGSVTDYSLITIDESDANLILQEHLHKSLAEPYVRRLFSSIDADDETQSITFVMNTVVEEQADIDFVTDSLAKWMVYEWLHKQVRSLTNTAQFFGGAEQKYFSQANHIAELRALQDDAYKEARDYIRDRGYINNSYLEG